MGEKIILLLLVLLLVANISSGITTFAYNETGLVSLQPKATDPDAQNLVYSYSEPLNENGEWQTTYGDAGEYKVTITVSDGELSSSQEVLLVVSKKEEKPAIESFAPKENKVAINEGESISFDVSASDLNKDTLAYEWFLDDVLVSNDKTINYLTDYEDAGTHNVKIVVSDKLHSVSNEWIVEVNDVSMENVLDSIQDIAVRETEIASLNLPDFKKYGLIYTISEPIGQNNKWQTSYDDAGTYKVTIKADGKGFSGSKQVKVTVSNNDRPPFFVDLKDIAINENEEAAIELNVQDPDNDDIIFSAQNMPDGAVLDGNTFRWKPDFNFVKKENLVDYIADKFHLLSKSVNIKFMAESNGNEAEKDVKITVRDANRPFTLEPIAPITIDENEEVKIEPRYNDPDNDRVSFAYSGWMAKNTYKTNFDDAGIYIVKVTGTDGFYTASEFVTVSVENVNRAPAFEPLKNAEITENKTLRMELMATDPDNDIIGFSAENLPENAELEGSIFTFKPDFSFVKGKEKESVKVRFVASDGQDSAEQELNITVFNKNIAPEIVNSSTDLSAKVNEPVTLFVAARDFDNDALSYLWDFGLFDKHNATAIHKRTFASKGKKEIKVTVSDGVEEISREFVVDVN
ncbi:hypothetical protein J4458_02215 [Candidatus Woesearchaeota archaeon]|nr:hypothetical protein [Candidatus Woesearchaeota archaeon]